MHASIKVEKLQEGLKTKFIGKYIFFNREVGSTNEWAKELVELGTPEGTVALAETQTAGRGRLGRKWISPRGGLWFSLVLKPNLKPSETLKLVFLISLVVAKTLRELYGLKVETKWPNDVLVNGRKVCGILLETKTVGEKVDYVIIGVGINANINVEEDFPRELRETAVSLEKALGRKVSLEELFKVLLEEFEVLYELFTKDGFKPILEAWKSYASFLGWEVEVLEEGEKLCGLALDVDDDGALVLRLEDGSSKRIFLGDVSMKIM